MPKVTSISMDPESSKLLAKNIDDKSSLKGAVSFQDLNKRPTATKTMGKRGSLKGTR